MKIAVKIYNQWVTLGAPKMSQFRIISRSASFTSCWRSLEAFRLCSLQGPSCLPSSFGHTRMSPLTNPSPWHHAVVPSSRLMSSRPPPLETNRDTVSLNDEERLTLVKAEYELYKAEGEFEMPSQITEKNLYELAQLRSVMARRKYLRFLFINEMKSIHQKQKKLEKQIYSKEKRSKLMEEPMTEEAYLQYGLWRNTFFIKWSVQHMNSIDCHRVIQAKLYGQPIVFDYGFEQHMVPRERKALAKQMAECIGMNRSHRDPFYLHFCNFKKDEHLGQLMLSAVPTLLNDDFQVDVHSEDYLDVFPKDKVVYLTPNSREEMKHFDHDAVYVIGGLVDTRRNEPITLAKGKKQNIKLQKLPLDRYLDWGSGNKALPLNQVLGVMLEMKRSGNWEEAFRKYIPRRKLIKPHEADPATIKRRMRGSNQEPKATGRPVRSYFKD